MFSSDGIDWGMVADDVTHISLETSDGEFHEFPRPEPITLKLTSTEAQTLRCVFARIGGDPETTRRGITDRVDSMLADAEVEDDGSEMGVRGYIEFSS